MQNIIKGFKLFLVNIIFKFSKNDLDRHQIKCKAKELDIWDLDSLYDFTFLLKNQFSRIDSNLVQSHNLSLSKSIQIWPKVTFLDFSKSDGFSQSHHSHLGNLIAFYTKNKFYGAIINEHAVFCICGQKVILDKDYDEYRLNEHSNNSRCKLNNKKRQLGLPGLFPIIPKKAKNTPSNSESPPSLLEPLTPNIPCPGLISEQISIYINRTPATYGSAC
ncbi:unnamed protein product [Rhizophagus irregularis]|nr:unnamed protein product [Rhizophagus irregularis]